MCGPGRLNPIGTAAKCNQPYSGDPLRDLARCCRTNKCELDLDCSCPMCTEYISIDDDHDNRESLNQHSVHLGIVNLWPLFYGLVDDENILSKLFDLLEDETRLMSAHGIRSLSAKDQFYMLDTMTYRGNLFIHLHYMLLRGLKNYYVEGSVSMQDKPELARRATDLYSSIKSKIVGTVYT